MTRKQILEEARQAGMTFTRDATGTEYIWITCHNCGGTGEYPSSVMPAGRCRFYCWKDRTPETFGKLPIRVDSYVRGVQRAQKRQAESEARAKRNQALYAERIQKLTAPDDPRMAALMATYDLDPDRVLRGEAETDTDRKPVRIAASLARRWAENDQLSPKQWDLIVSLTEQEQQRLNTPGRHEHVGNVGERLDLPGLTCVMMRDYPDPSWGSRWLVRFVDEVGHVFVWWASGRPPVNEGEKVTVRGTIKKHTEYRGESQTVLTRCVILVDEEEESDATD